MKSKHLAVCLASCAGLWSYASPADAHTIWHAAFDRDGIGASATVTLNDSGQLLLTVSSNVQMPPPEGSQSSLTINGSAIPFNAQNAPLGVGLLPSLQAGTAMLRATWFFDNQVNHASATFALTHSHPPPPVTYLLAEGATGSFFDTEVLIANPNPTDVTPVLSFLRDDGVVVEVNVTVPALSRRTFRPATIAGLESTAMSTTVRTQSDTPLFVERTMRWGSTGYGGHAERASAGPSETWFFAEGAQGFFHTYLLLANPQTGSNTAHVRFLIEDAPPIERSFTIGPRTRRTVDAGTIPALQNQAFGMTVTFDQPGMAERAMYFGNSPLFAGGHGSAGVTAPATNWIFAEGATGPFFETFVLIVNPSTTQTAAIEMLYQTSNGDIVTRSKSVLPSGRLTINIEAEGDPALTNAAVASQVSSSIPVVAERAQYWPDPASHWFEAHNSFGTNASARRWGLAEGRVGGPEAYQTYILLANRGTSDAEATLQFLLETGAAFQKVFRVPASGRVNVSVGPGTPVPELIDARFGVAITATEPIAVERSMYWNAGGQVWAAGTNAAATPWP